MSYRFNTPGYDRTPARGGMPSARNIMIALIGAFVVLTLVVILAGRLPFTPTPTAVEGATYRDYLADDQALLSSYGYTLEGRVHIPIEEAMRLTVERGLPVRDNPSATPGD